jgi:hypothetical protein
VRYKESVAGLHADWPRPLRAHNQQSSFLAGHCFSARKQFVDLLFLFDIAHD